MIKANFNLKNQKAEAKTSIILVLLLKSRRFKYYTGCNIEPKNWDIKTQRAKNVVVSINKDTINTLLEGLQNEVLKINQRCIYEGVELTQERLKDGLDEFTGKKVLEVYGFKDVYKEYINGALQRVDSRTGKLLSKETQRKYAGVLKIVEEYETYSQKELTFEGVTKEFMRGFISWQTEVKQYAVNNIDKNVQVLKSFLNYATEKGYNKNLEYRERSFKTSTEKTEHIYLSEKEIMKIVTLNLAGMEALDNARDLFIWGNFTGLRFSDVTSIKKEHIKGGFIELHQTKTGGKVTIPLHEVLRINIEKRGGEPPRPISNQKLNEYIKQVCRIAGICEVVEKQTTKGGKRIKVMFEKWELVTTHTARRSFASNLYAQKVPVQTIMKLTGHKTQAAFYAYIKLSDMEHANIIKNIWDNESK